MKANRGWGREGGKELERLREKGERQRVRDRQRQKGRMAWLGVWGDIPNEEWRLGSKRMPHYHRTKRA